MNRLYLSFTGLCEFVPRYPLDTHPCRNEMRVLLADSRQHLTIPHPGPHERHLARLICPYDSVDRRPGCRVEDSSFEKSGNYWATFFLDDQDLFLGSNRKALEIELSEDTECPDFDNRCSFHWAGPLGTISPGSEIVKEGCFARSFPEKSVITRVALTDGSIGSHRIAMSDDQIVKWKFKVPEGDLEEPSERALADSVLYDVGFATETIEIRTRLFRTATNPRVGLIYPDGPGSELKISLFPTFEEVHASVKNMPEPDINGTRHPGPRSEIDHHFAHVYEMSANVRRQNVPHRAASDCPGGPLEPCGRGMQFVDDFLHRGNPNCPPPQAAAHPNEDAWNFDWPTP